MPCIPVYHQHFHYENLRRTGWRQGSPKEVACAHLVLTKNRSKQPRFELEWHWEGSSHEEPGARKARILGQWARDWDKIWKTKAVPGRARHWKPAELRVAASLYQFAVSGAFWAFGAWSVHPAERSGGASCAAPIQSTGLLPGGRYHGVARSAGSPRPRAPCLVPLQGTPWSLHPWVPWRT